VGTAAAFGQQPAQPQNGVPVIQQNGVPVIQQNGVPVIQQNGVPLIQPGAPGKPEKILTEATTAGTGPQGPTEADVKFMQGMIMHHSQAVEMVALMPGRTKNPKMLALGQRISISQSDEIKFMKRWLTYRNKPLTEMGDMAGMEHAGMEHMDMPLMPGMLTPKQMAALRKAAGAKFDQLFLTGMIQHHGGALTMVNDLFDTPSAAQDPQLFDFTADIGVTQQGEIDTMRNMLATEK
jgi:uncharacterized protein (DUF305 family)